jgi:hypothetical protein
MQVYKGLLHLRLSYRKVKILKVVVVVVVVVVVLTTFMSQVVRVYYAWYSFGRLRGHWCSI